MLSGCKCVQMLAAQGVGQDGGRDLCAADESQQGREALLNDLLARIRSTRVGGRQPRGRYDDPSLKPLDYVFRLSMPMLSAIDPISS